ncbi:MAG: prepilin peptidase [Firmicutes bacterium]|nr:prepilin peptidase [Bacillota bacterium]
MDGRRKGPCWIGLLHRALPLAPGLWSGRCCVKFFSVSEIFVFVLGLVVGSFLNVCIYRLPRGESVVRPRSRCPACGVQIRARDNLPVVSYLLLGGRCRHCRAVISPLYPAVELLTGLLFVACYGAFGATVAGAKWMAFAALLVVLFFADLRERILPDAVNYTGLAIGLGFSFFSGPDDGTALWLSRKLFAMPPPDPVLAFADALAGAALGGGMLWLVGEGYFRLRGREGMGLGDVKMMLMVGAFLGAKLTLLAILLGSLGGSVLGLLYILVWRKGSNYELPFGSFLAGAALVTVFFGAPVIAWYQRVAGF